MVAFAWQMLRVVNVHLRLSVNKSGQGLSHQCLS